ncbi:MAG: HAMP domain-containing sensor histidine kinase [Propionibacteriaceae bacterium]|nr:HAMP domain-containing sensor histidine kinase [Propionibacteriaceae bacterium]
MTRRTVRVGDKRGSAVSARNRIIGWMMLLVALALTAEVVIAAQVFTGRAEAELDQELFHEGEKLRDFAERSVDPVTGSSYQSADALLTAYLSVAVPNSDETLFSISDGRPSHRAREEPIARLDLDEAFIASIAELTEPTAGRATSDAGPIHWAVFPVEMEGDTSAASLAVIEFAAPARARAASTVRVLAVISAIALVLAGVASWQVAGRVLAPIRTLRQTAENIGESALDQRIAVTGRDDVAALAHTFNAMLDRLQDAFAGQQQFLDDASHELRTPITVVRGHLELMGDDPAEREHTLGLVLDELKRMDRMVDDLMLLARAERPDFLRISEVDVSDLLMEVLAKASALGDRRWALDGLPEQMVMADGQRLTQALMQLAANAVRHTAEGARITIGGSVVENHLKLSVSDEGTGIAEEDRVGIFDRFARAGYRGDGGRRGEGAGLGLAIVTSIAHAHGGRVRLKSKVGEGSQFTLEIPLVEFDQPDRAAVRSTERAMRP